MCLNAADDHILFLEPQNSSELWIVILHTFDDWIKVKIYSEIEPPYLKIIHLVKDCTLKQRRVFKLSEEVILKRFKQKTSI